MYTSICARVRVSTRASYLCRARQAYVNKSITGTCVRTCVHTGMRMYVHECLRKRLYARRCVRAVMLFSSRCRSCCVSAYLCVCVRTYVHMCTCMYAMRTRKYLCMGVCGCVRKRACAYVCSRVLRSLLADVRAIGTSART